MSRQEIRMGKTPETAHLCSEDRDSVRRRNILYKPLM
jgi:hypothetical protein